MIVRCFLALVALLAVPLAAAPLSVSNRVPKPNEIGYVPADGSSARLNPPSFLWLHEAAAHRYTIEWATNSSFNNAASAASLPFNTYTHSAPLPAGTYHWRYKFSATNGAESGWSQTRSVTVPPGAPAFPMPSRAEQ